MTPSFRPAWRAALALVAAAAAAQQVEPFEEPPISYSATPAKDVATAINARFQAQADEIRSLPAKKRLKWLLDELGIPAESQLLVFSKTSLQVDRISATTPRALYFGDDTTIGYVQGGLLEVATFDARDGVALYTRPMAGPTRSFERHSAECASCHGVTRLLLQSVTPARDGMPLLAFTGSELPINVDYRTPFEQRWGGWYVTGTHGTMRHRGNAVAPDPLKPYDLDLSANTNRTTLPDTIDRTQYLAPTSDIVALMTYELSLIHI